jgi:lipopolysaccharide export system permease protein
VRYIGHLLPEIIIQVLPAAALFSTSYIFGMLNSTNEIIAVYNGRIGFIRVIVPLFITGIVLGIALFFFFEFVATDSSVKAFELRNNIKKLAGKDIHYLYSRAKFFLKGKDSTYYYLENFDSKDGTLHQPLLSQFDENGRLEFQIYGFRGMYDWRQDLWEFTKAVKTSYGKDGRYHEERADSIKVQLAEKPEDFMKKPVSVMQMNIEKAVKFIESKKSAGANFKRELVEYHWRFAFPFSVVIIILIGSVAGIYFRKAVLVLSFFLSILLSFGYYGLLALGMAFGKSGRLSPVLAAWIANFVYLFAGIIAVKLKR